MNDDATLVELAKSGDQAAFAELYERYFDRVYDFLARMVHDSSEAADLTQDAFLKAMNSLNTLTKGTSFKSWLFTIARNTALNRLERASRTQPLEGTNDAGEEQTFDVIDADRFGNPEEAAEANSLASVVWEAAAALDPKYRSVLLLNLREGLDSAEIADVMGVTKNHAYVLVNRMKSALESAVGAVALFRNGRRHCAELDAVIERLQVAELSPEARRVIERHAGKCATCQEQRNRLASPFAIFAGMAIVQPAPGVKETIFGGLQEAYALSFGNAGASGPASDGGGASQAGSSGASAGHTNPMPVAGDSDGGWPAGTPAAGSDGSGWNKRRVAVLGGAAALLLLIGAPLVAVGFFKEDESAGLAAAVVESPTAAVASAATALPTATPTRTATATATHTVTPVPTDTPTPEPPTVVPIEPGPAGPNIAPGGGEPPTTEPPTPIPAQPGPVQPDITAPDNTGDEPPDTGSNLQPPNPHPPETCTYTMSATPGVLVYDGSSRSNTFVLQGDGCGAPLDITLETGARWVIVMPETGSIPVDGSLTVTVFVDIEDRTADSSRVHVTSLAGSLEIIITIDLPPEEVPPGGRGDGSTDGGNDNNDDGGGDDEPDDPVDPDPPCSSVYCPPPPGGPGGLTN